MADRPYEDVTALVQAELRDRHNDPNDEWRHPWIIQTYDDHVVYSWDGKTWAADYTVTDADGETTCEVAEEKEVQVTYSPIGEAAKRVSQLLEVPGVFRAKEVKERIGRALRYDFPFAEDMKAAAAKASDLLEGDFVPLMERAVRSDDTISIKLIEPGWGSSGYYSPELLETEGPATWPAGTKMYWDHPTESEETERPERSLRDLAAELVTDPKYLEDGTDGAGLYADAKVFSAYKESIDELAPHMGTSVRALGRVKEGEADGKKGPIVEKLHIGQSVDFVTEPGAGGKVVDLFEAARPSTRRKPKEVGNMDEIQKLTEAKDAAEQKVKDLEESNKTTLKERDDAVTEAKRRAEALVLAQAEPFVKETIGEIEKETKVSLLDATRKRLTESLAKDPVTNDDGELDKDAYKTKIAETFKAEVAYLTEAMGGGKVTNMGDGDPAPGDGEDPKKLEEAQDKAGAAFEALGLKPETTKGILQDQA